MCASETDVIHVLKGSSTFIIGGHDLRAEGRRRRGDTSAHPALVQERECPVPLLHSQTHLQVSSRNPHYEPSLA